MSNLTKLLLLFLSLLLGGLLSGKSTIAISDFDNVSGLGEYDPIAKGLANLLITDLSNLRAIQIVERDKLGHLVEEMGLGQAGLIDESSAQQVGKLLGAEYIMSGSFLILGDDMRIDTRLIRVETGEIAMAAKVSGTKESFFDLEKQLVDRLIAGLNLTISKSEKKEAREVQTRSFDSFFAYSKGVARSDEGEFEDAKKFFEKAVDLDPEFSVARKSLDQIKEWLIELEKERETLLEQEMERLITGLDFSSPDFSYKVQGIWSQLVSSFSYALLLKFNDYLRHQNLDLSKNMFEGSPFVFGEMLSYYDCSALSALKRYEDLINPAQEFLKEYPISMYYSAIKIYLEQAIGELEERKKGKESAKNEIQNREIEYYREIVEEYYRWDGEFLTDKDYQIARGLFVKWVLRTTPPDLVSYYGYSSDDKDYAKDSYDGEIREHLTEFKEIAEKFHDREIIEQIVEAARKLFKDTDYEEEIYDLEDFFDSYRQEQGRINALRTEIGQRKTEFLNPTSENKYEWRSRLHSLEKAGGDSLLIVVGLKHLDSRIEDKSDDPFDERNDLWDEVFSAAGRTLNFEFCEQLLQEYEKDRLLKKYDSKKHRRNVSERKLDYRKDKKRYEEFHERVSDLLSRKKLLMDIADIYRDRHQYPDEISTRLETLKEFRLSDDQTAMQHYLLFNAYSNIGYFEKALEVGNELRSEFPNSDWTSTVEQSLGFLPR